MKIKKVIADPSYTIELTKDEYFMLRTALAVVSTNDEYSATERAEWDRLWNELYAAV